MGAGVECGRAESHHLKENMLDREQLRRLVIWPALEDIGHWAQAAEHLVLGTALVESSLTYLHQLNGPALGLWQCEPATHADIWTNYLAYRPELARKVMVAAGRGTRTPRQPPDEWLVYNLRYAAAICRVHYLRAPEAIPEDAEGLAAYHKRYYNSALGATELERSIPIFREVCQ